MPESNESLSQVYELMDKALAAEKGIKIQLDTPGMATKLRHRCYQARVAERRASKVINKPEDKLYGKSVYDVLKFDIDESKSSLIILNKGTEMAAMGIEGVEEI